MGSKVGEISKINDLTDEEKDLIFTVIQNHLNTKIYPGEVSINTVDELEVLAATLSTFCIKAYTRIEQKQQMIDFVKKSKRVN